MLLSDFDFILPNELIAQQPLPDRAASRMLVLHRDSGAFEDRLFAELPGYLKTGDCLVLNDTRVFPSRLFGKKPDYARPVEVFLLRPQTPDRLTWTALARPGRHLHTGARVDFTPRLYATILESLHHGERLLRFTCTGDFNAELHSIGHVPLPPYIHRPDTPADFERYQTVYAAHTGSVAAPTAGLHFTPAVLDACRSAGASLAPITLHVSLGTFQPLDNPEIEANQLHTEPYSISPDSAALINAATRRIAVGTTSVRTLETAARNCSIVPHSGETNIFIYPGHRFRAVDAILTNFHLPQSSLLLLTAAFAGQDLILAAYRHAVELRYRFFSYGDCMLIL